MRCLGRTAWKLKPYLGVGMEISKKTFTLQDLIDEGAEEALGDLTDLLQMWKDHNRIRRPAIAMLSLEIVVLAIAKSEGLGPESIANVREQADKLMPHVNVEIVSDSKH